MAKAPTTFLTLPLELRQKILLLATDLVDEASEAQLSVITYNLDLLEFHGVVNSPVWWAIRDGWKVMGSVDTTITTFGKLLSMPEVRPDLHHVAQMQFKKVDLLTAQYLCGVRTYEIFDDLDDLYTWPFSYTIQKYSGKSPSWSAGYVYVFDSTNSPHPKAVPRTEEISLASLFAVIPKVFQKVIKELEKEVRTLPIPNQDGTLY